MTLYRYKISYISEATYETEKAYGILFADTLEEFGIILEKYYGKDSIEKCDFEVLYSDDIEYNLIDLKDLDSETRKSIIDTLQEGGNHDA